MHQARGISNAKHFELEICRGSLCPLHPGGERSSIFTSKDMAQFLRVIYPPALAFAEVNSMEGLATRKRRGCITHQNPSVEIHFRGLPAAASYPTRRGEICESFVGQL